MEDPRFGVGTALLVGVVRADDSLHERVPDHVFVTKPGKGNTVHVFEYRLRHGSDHFGSLWEDQSDWYRL